MRPLLTRCTSLRTLELYYDTGFNRDDRAGLSSILFGLRLSTLRRLVLDGVGVDADAVRDFHPSLERLHLCAAPRFDMIDVVDGAIPSLTSYAPRDAHCLLHIAIVIDAPRLNEVVTSAQQMHQFRDEQTRLPWLTALYYLRETLRTIGTWDLGADVNLVQEVVQEGLLVQREAKDPWVLGLINELT